MLKIIAFIMMMTPYIAAQASSDYQLACNGAYLDAEWPRPPLNFNMPHLPGCEVITSLPGTLTLQDCKSNQSRHLAIVDQNGYSLLMDAIELDTNKLHYRILSNTCGNLIVLVDHAGEINYGTLVYRIGSLTKKIGVINLLGDQDSLVFQTRVYSENGNLDFTFTGQVYEPALGGQYQKIMGDSLTYTFDGFTKINRKAP